jgi:hypothetical protein
MANAEFTVVEELEDGEKTLSLDPPLELIDRDELTLREMSMGCYIMGIDPDKVLHGEEVELPHRPRLENARRMMRLCVHNHQEYEIGTMPAYQVDAILGVVVNHFINASRGR